jgi:hypothetical protein
MRRRIRDAQNLTVSAVLRRFYAIDLPGVMLAAEVGLGIPISHLSIAADNSRASKETTISVLDNGAILDKIGAVEEASKWKISLRV